MIFCANNLDLIYKIKKKSTAQDFIYFKLGEVFSEKRVV